MKTGRPSVLLLTRHAFTINPCCEYGEERQVTGNKTITDNLLQEAGVCECVCGVSGTDKHLFLFFFLFFINKMTMTESNVRNGKC